MRYVRCPGCHLRMETAAELEADQAELAWRTGQKASGAAFVNWPAPESDARTFPCRRCGTAIQRGALVKGTYNETIPRWLVVEVPVVAAATAYLIGWIFGWGPVAGIIAGAIACAASAKIFFDLHHGLTENHKLAQRGLPPTGFGLSGGVKFIVSLLVVLGVAAGLYQSMGWFAVVIAVMVAIVVLVIISAIIGKRRDEAKKASIAEQNQEQIDRISRRR